MPGYIKRSPWLWEAKAIKRLDCEVRCAVAVQLYSSGRVALKITEENGMSNKLLTQVLDGAPFGGAKLLTLIALANFANDDGECWPSIGTIAKQARVSPRSATRIIGDLEADGWVVRKPRRGRANVYFISPVLGDDTSDRGDTGDRGTPVIAVSPTPDIAVSPRTTKEPLKNDGVARAREAGLVTKPGEPAYRTAMRTWAAKCAPHLGDVVEEQIFLYELHCSDRKQKPTQVDAVKWLARERDWIRAHPVPQPPVSPVQEFRTMRFEDDPNSFEAIRERMRQTVS
jgi:hypothetical protein